MSTVEIDPSKVPLVDLPSVEEMVPRLPPVTPPVPVGGRKFNVYRRFDRSGGSGTGHVIQGWVSADGQCAYQWMNGKSPELEYRQTFQKLLDIHIIPHPENHSVVVWEPDVDGHVQVDYYGPQHEQVST